MMLVIPSRLHPSRSKNGPSFSSRTNNSWSNSFKSCKRGIPSKHISGKRQGSHLIRSVHKRWSWFWYQLRSYINLLEVKRTNRELPQRTAVYHHRGTNPQSLVPNQLCRLPLIRPFKRHTAHRDNHPFASLKISEAMRPWLRPCQRRLPKIQFPTDTWPTLSVRLPWSTFKNSFARCFMSINKHGRSPLNRFQFIMRPPRQTETLRRPCQQHLGQNIVIHPPSGCPPMVWEFPGCMCDWIHIPNIIPTRPTGLSAAATRPRKCITQDPLSCRRRQPTQLSD